MRKIPSWASFTLLLMALTGCNPIDNNEKLLATAQEFYDQHNPSGNSQLCFYVGDIELPYTAKQLTFPESPKPNVWVNNELNRRLELFSQLGLLDKTALNDQNQYQLSDADNINFKNGSFCFGKIIAKSLTITKANAASVSSQLAYEIQNIPAWVSDPRFTDYFYLKEIRYYSYPNLTDGKFPHSGSSAITLARLKEGGLILSDSQDLLSMLYQYGYGEQWDKKHQLYAYYDLALAERFIEQSLISQTLFAYWGEADPLLLASVTVTPNVARASNMVLLLSHIDELSSPNKIATIEAETVNQYLENVSFSRTDNRLKYSIQLDRRGLLSGFKSRFKVSNSVSGNVLTAEEDIATNTLTWTFRSLFSMNVSANNQIDPFATQSIDRNVDIYVYHSDRFGKLSSYTEGKAQQPMPINYDEAGRLTSFRDINFKYKGEQLVSYDDGKDRQTFIYDKNNRLIKRIGYSLTPKKATENEFCDYTKHNPQGDWLEKRCSNSEKTTRTLSYYE